MKTKERASVGQLQSHQDVYIDSEEGTELIKQPLASFLTSKLYANRNKYITNRLGGQIQPGF